MPHTEIIEGERQWIMSPLLKDMFSQYQYKYSQVECKSFFSNIFKEELGLSEGCSSEKYNGYFLHIPFHSECRKSTIEKSTNLVVGDKVFIFIFEEYDWVVKNGDFEEVVEDMEIIFEAIRRAWDFWDSEDV